MRHKTIIVDDEQNSVSALQKLIEIYCPQLEVDCTFNDPRLALQYIISDKPELIFLDIQMPFMSGIELIKNIPINESHIIFTTAYDQYAINAIKLSALDYLLKPIDVQDLNQAVNKFLEVKNADDNYLKLSSLLDNIENRNSKKLVVQLQSKTLFLNISDINYLEADSNYTHIYMEDGVSHMTSKTIKYFQEKLEAFNFFRPHQSFLIRAENVIEYNKSDNCIVLRNKKIIPVSKNKKDELMRLLSH